jgi:hypothetical protein
MRPSEQHRVKVEIARKLLGRSDASDHRTILRLPSGEHVPVEVHGVRLAEALRVVGIFGVAEVGFAPLGPASADPLTTRQQEILRLLVLGCSTKQIAEVLSLSETTVRKPNRVCCECSSSTRVSRRSSRAGDSVSLSNAIRPSSGFKWIKTRAKHVARMDVPQGPSTLNVSPSGTRSTDRPDEERRSTFSGGVDDQRPLTESFGTVLS